MSDDLSKLETLAQTYFDVNTINHRHEDIGWRPVLEVL